MSSAAEAQGYERASKYDKSSKCGKQNPIAERWNSNEQLILWRKPWVDVRNLYLEQVGRAEGIDHRNHTERGLNGKPIVREGIIDHALEKESCLGAVN